MTGDSHDSENTINRGSPHSTAAKVRECAFAGCTFPSPCPDHEMSAEFRQACFEAGHRCSPECIVPLTWKADEHATVLLGMKVKVRR